MPSIMSLWALCLINAYRRSAFRRKLAGSCGFGLKHPVCLSDLPGYCPGDLRMFGQLVSLCLQQLPLPEKTPTKAKKSR